MLVVWFPNITFGDTFYCQILYILYYFQYITLRDLNVTDKNIKQNRYTSSWPQNQIQCKVSFIKSQSVLFSGSHSPRSPESSSTCSSRDPSPGKPVPGNRDSHAPSIRRQSTTEEILIARGFRRQSTTEEMIRCRNFRRQSSQSDDCSRYRGRRDSSAQITDGTLATMTVETTSTFFDSSTQTGKILIY